MNYQRQAATNTICKDSHNKKLSGVCAGLAHHFNVPRVAMRIAAIVSLFMFPVVTGVAYLVATMLMPNLKRY